MFGTSQEHYRELGVQRHASIAEIKAAFRRKAMTWHPDRNKDTRAEEVFKRIKCAYEILSDEARRRAYDEENPPRSQSGSAWGSGPASSPPPWGPSHSSARAHTGRTDRRPPPAWEPPPRPQPKARLKGRELRRIIEIPLELAVSGGKYDASFYAGHVCPSCTGEGEVTGRACIHCFGSGKVRDTFGLWHDCPECAGDRQVRALCPECLGTGLTQQLRNLRVTLPAGVSEGMVLRLKEAGTESRSGGPRGDVLFTVRLAGHRHYRVKGLQLYASLAVDFSRVWLGGILRVRTLWGPVELDIPPLRKGPIILRLTRYGLPDLRKNARGDLLVRVSDGQPAVAGYLAAP